MAVGPLINPQPRELSYGLRCALSTGRPTAGERFDAVRERIVALHPYELPEVVAVDIARGLPAYLDWIERETQP